MRYFSLVAAYLLCGLTFSYAQTSTVLSGVTAFLDCKTYCDEDFIRTEIKFVSYVTDRSQANVHVLITSEDTGGGRVYHLEFLGLKDFEGQNQKLDANTMSTDTDDSIRKKQLQVLKAGLMRYVAQTAALNQIGFTFQAPPEGSETTTETVDKWNKWTFSVSGGGNAQAESQYNSKSFGVRLNASRTSDKWKSGGGISARRNESSYKIDETENIKNVNRSGSLFGFATYALAKKWSVQARGYVERSSYENTDVGFGFVPGIEYTVFPYSETSRRALRFQYTPKVEHVKYFDKTVYGKEKENLFSQKLTTYIEMNQPWGDAGVQLQSSHYFHDLSKYRFTLGANVNWNIAKGLTLRVGGLASYIRDQLSLPAGDLKPADILLRQQQLATNYEYRTYFQITYRFGSFINNVVNQRFEESYAGYSFYGF